MMFDLALQCRSDAVVVVLIAAWKRGLVLVTTFACATSVARLLFCF